MYRRFRFDGSADDGSNSRQSSVFRRDVRYNLAAHLRSDEHGALYWGNLLWVCPLGRLSGWLTRCCSRKGVTDSATEGQSADGFRGAARERG
jgi:hypothetical protein